MKKTFIHFPWEIRKSFTFRIFRSICSVLLISLITLTCLNCFKLSSREINQNIYSGTNTLDQTASFIEYRVQAVEGIINVISYDNTIQTVLSNSSDYYNKNISNWNIHTTSCREIFYNSYTTNNIGEVRLYSSSGPAAFEETDDFKLLSSAMQTEWYNRLRSTDDSALWLPPSFFESESTDNNSGNVLYVLKISDLNHLKRYLGYITATVPSSIFSDIINQGEVTVNTSLTLYNSFGEVVASNNPLFEGTTEIQDLADKYAVSETAPLQKVRYKGDSYLMGIRNIENSDWTLAIAVPYHDIIATTQTFEVQMMLSVLVILMLLIPIMYHISASLNSRIIVLKNMMANSAAGNFSTEPIDNGDDEIGDLTNSFYSMQSKIAKLVDHQYRLGYEIKDLEFQILQAQINPHFLYNTLDMIYWMGLKFNCPAVSEAASKLGEFYTLSLGHGEKIVSIQDELRHIQAYAAIQNMRFENHITLIDNIPSELYQYYIIKIILQPLVENAINHGILERDDETGTIVVYGEKIKDVIKLYVIDNGIGIPADKLETLLTKNSSQKKHGYGVWNIHERLKLSYGEAYGLRYESHEGKGTTVCITFPAISVDREIE